MKVLISLRAAKDLDAAFKFIADDNPQAAVRTFDGIVEAIESWGTLPSRGRPGAVSGTRELVLPSTGHLVIYSVAAVTVTVLRVRHGRQDSPA